MGRQPDNGVDMAVGVIADEMAMVYPDNALGMEEVGEQAFHHVAQRQVLVTVRSQEALAGGEDSALAIALDAAAFEDKALMVLHGCILECTLIVELQVDGIVFLPGKLLSPSVELEVEQVVGDDIVVMFSLGDYRDRSMVACPCVVTVYFVEADTLHLSWRQPSGERSSGALQERSDNEQMLETRDSLGKLQIGLCYLKQIGMPIGVGVGPCEHDAALRFPLCRQYEIARYRLIHKH